MEFAPKPGCPMCGIVASAQRDPLASPGARPRSSLAASTEPDILWRDDDFTVYRERANPVSTKGHIIIAFNLHVPSLYALSSSDLPLLSALKALAARHLSSLLAQTVLTPITPANDDVQTFNAPLPSNDASKFCIGFITPPFKDNKIPVTDHLHAHAYVPPNDLAGWWRSVAYGPLAWYAVDDLIAEIRETTSNNRIKTGYNKHGEHQRPIDTIPDAGARYGTAYGIETTEAGVASADLEAGGLSPYSARPRTPNTLVPQLALSPPPA